MRILLTGASGFLCRPVAAALGARHAVTGICLNEATPIPGCDLRRLDLTDAEATRRVIGDLAPDLVIHAAALSKPDHCEKDHEAARKINVEGTLAVARAAQEAGARLFYISTDLVFDGKKPPYSEEAAVNPLSFYARTKVEAEQIARRECARTLILRLSLCYGWKPVGEPFFTDQFFQSLGRGRKIRLFTDQYRAFLFIEDAVEMIRRLAALAPIDVGVLHMAGPDRISRCRFGEILCEVFGFDKKWIEPARMEDVPSPVFRPRDCSLDGSRLNALLGFQPRGVREGLERLKESAASSGVRL